MTATKPLKVALLFPGALGDFICLLPALHALAESAQVEVYSKPAFAEIVPRTIRVAAIERREINQLFVAGAALEAPVRDFFAPYDRIYSWTGSNQEVFSAQLNAVAPGRAQLFPFFGPDAALHQTDYYLSCLRLTRETSPAVKIPLTPEALQWRAEFAARYALQKKALLVMAPGSGAREKNWPPAHFAAVGRWWRERADGEVVILLGPVERERGGYNKFFEEFIVTADLNLAQAAALLCRSDLFIGNDSGMTHLAAALDAPTIAIFGPSNARRWAPRGTKVTVVSLGVACSPCEIAAMKVCSERQCLNDFSPSRIIEEVEKSMK